MNQVSIFNKCKKEFKKALYAGLIDKNIIQLLTKLNDNPRLATRFSCEGHLEENDGSFYIQFVENNNVSLLIEIYEKLRDELTAYNSREIKEPFYIFALMLIIGSNTENNNHDCLKTITITYEPIAFISDKVFESEHQKSTFIEIFLKILDKFEGKSYVNRF